MGAGQSIAMREHIGVQVEPPSPGQSGVYRHHDYGNALRSAPDPDQPDLGPYQMFLETCKVRGDADCLGVRQQSGGGGDTSSASADAQWGPSYTYTTYAETAKTVNAIASGLAATSVCKPGACIGIYSVNRPEWVTCLMALWRQGMVCVPFYDTLGAQALEFILGDAE
eukprot:UC1_evm1s834